MVKSPQMSGVLDILCPMHVELDADGVICHAGPTLVKLYPDTDCVGQGFFDLFEVSRPKKIANMTGLMAVAGQKLHLRKKIAPQTGLKGVLVAGDAEGAVVNLGFGISILDAVQDYDLSAADFAATDLTIEMLYLVEAKSAAMEASRKLNLRLQGAMIAAEEQAFTDTLTGLKNRRALDHILPRMVSDCTPFGLMQVDLDFFKEVNDSRGHAAGDTVLQHVARVLVESSREEDCVARVGGDEFVLVFNGTTNADVLRRIAGRIISEIERPVPFRDAICKVSASVGIAIYDGNGETSVEQLLDDADTALYASKHAGRATFKVYDPEMRDSGPLAM